MSPARTSSWRFARITVADPPGARRPCPPRRRPPRPRRPSARRLPGQGRDGFDGVVDEPEQAPGALGVPEEDDQAILGGKVGLLVPDLIDAEAAFGLARPARWLLDEVLPETGEDPALVLVPARAAHGPLTPGAAARRSRTAGTPPGPPRRWRSRARSLGSISPAPPWRRLTVRVHRRDSPVARPRSLAPLSDLRYRVREAKRPEGGTAREAQAPGTSERVAPAGRRGGFGADALHRPELG